MLDHARIDKDRDLGGKPRGESQAKGMGYSESRAVLGPEGLEVDGQADLAAAVHLMISERDGDGDGDETVRGLIN